MAGLNAREPKADRIGVLGGTFDPVHRGHLAMARAARAAHGLGTVLLVPAFSPPHKQGELTPFRHRLAMVEIAVAGEEWLRASDLEGRRGGVSYTVESLAELRRALGGAEIYFIIGEDSIPELPRWKDLPRILALARLVAVNRPGPRQSFRSPAFSTLPPETIARLERDRVEMEPVPISSREIRSAIRAGQPVGEWLPPGVAEYIRAHGLYRDRFDPQLPTSDFRLPTS